MFPSQDQQTQPQEPLGQLLDKAITNLFNVQAQNRFTRAPVDIKTIHPRLNGEYNPATGRISIYTTHADPMWYHFQKVMTHEGIHSLLANSGFIPNVTNRPKSEEAKKLNEKMVDLFKFNYMGGIPSAELPAYVGSGGMPGDYGDQIKWFENFRSTMSESNRKLLERLVRNYEQSKKDYEPDESTRIK